MNVTSLHGEPTLIDRLNELDTDLAREAIQSLKLLKARASRAESEAFQLAEQIAESDEEDHEWIAAQRETILELRDALEGALKCTPVWCMCEAHELLRRTKGFSRD